MSSDPASLHLPEKVAAEDEAEHEHKEADAQHNDIDIEWKVIDVRRHAAVVFRAPRSRTTQASWQEEFAEANVSDRFSEGRVRDVRSINHFLYNFIHLASILKG